MASGSRSFNFGSDDVLCSYDDCAAQDSSSTRRSDPPSKDFAENRMARPLVNIYEQEEDFASIVERCMKKYADTLMRSLDGVSGRISQLEMHCYKVERSVGELRGDMVQGQSQADLKFKSLEKHMQEVHRAVQILRDKQELADAQKELAKLQMLQKESTQKPEEPAPTQTKTPLPESTKHEDSPKQLSNSQLALVPSTQQQLSLPQLPSPIPLQQDQYNLNHPTTYQSLPPPGYQYVQARPQLQEIPVQPQMLHQLAPKPAPFPQYQQQWTPQHQPNPNPNPNPSPQQFTGQSSQPVPPSQQTQLRPHMPQGYSPYPPSQPSNPISETYPAGMSIPSAYSNPSQSGMNRANSVLVGYGNQGNPRPAQPPPNQGSFGPPSQIAKGGYSNVPPYGMQAPMQGNATSYNAGSYNFPPNNVLGGHMSGPQLSRNSPYGEFIEKAVSMGYPRDQVVSITMKMAESGQHMDLNALLDRLNGGSVTNQWSG